MKKYILSLAGIFLLLVLLVGLPVVVSEEAVALATKGFGTEILGSGTLNQETKEIVLDQANPVVKTADGLTDISGVEQQVKGGLPQKIKFASDGKTVERAEFTMKEKNSITINGQEYKDLPAGSRFKMIEDGTVTINGKGIKGDVLDFGGVNGKGGTKFELLNGKKFSYIGKDGAHSLEGNFKLDDLDIEGEVNMDKSGQITAMKNTIVNKIELKNDAVITSDEIFDESKWSGKSCANFGKDKLTIKNTAVNLKEGNPYIRMREGNKVYVRTNENPAYISDFKIVCKDNSYVANGNNFFSFKDGKVNELKLQNNFEPTKLGLTVIGEDLTFQGEKYSGTIIIDTEKKYDTFSYRVRDLFAEEVEGWVPKTASDKTQAPVESNVREIPERTDLGAERNKQLEEKSLFEETAPKKGEIFVNPEEAFKKSIDAIGKKFKEDRERGSLINEIYKKDLRR